MSENTNTGEWRVTRDKVDIQEWADRRGLSPVDRGTGDTVALDLERDPATDEISWETFFDRFDRERLVFRHRESAPEGERGFQILGPDEVDDERASPAEGGDPDGVETEGLPTSDTGDSEPVATESVKREGSEDPTSETPGQPGDDARERLDRIGERVGDDEDEHPSTSPIGDEAATAGPASGLVLDAVHEHRPGEGSRQDEHVTFENAGDEPIDLSGWLLTNGEGRTFRFPEGTVLGPDERLRVHSGGPESAETPSTDGDLFWEADEPIWRTRGDTVVVKTPDGERILQEKYKGGRSEPG